MMRIPTEKGRGRLHFAFRLAFMLLLICGGAVPRVSAHFATVGYSDIVIEGSSLQYTLYLDPQEVVQWLDMNSGQKVFVIDPNTPSRRDSQGEEWNRAGLERMVERFLTVRNGEAAGAPKLKEAGLAERGGSELLRMEIEYSFDRPIREYGIRYHFFFDDMDPQHQNMAHLQAGNVEEEKVFDEGNREWTGSVGRGLQAGARLALPAWAGTIWTYTLMGMKHIWSGYDHLLFLFGLLILKQDKWSYLKLLTAFTLGHSLTLALSALGVAAVSVRLVEPLIALSIVYVAAENIWLKHSRWRWAVALLFGLVHGFGFADILRGNLGGHPLLTLFSFNAGVEIGQLAVWAILLPLLSLLGRVRWYSVMMRGMSGAIGFLGLLWFIQRIAG